MKERPSYELMGGFVYHRDIVFSVKWWPTVFQNQVSSQLVGPFRRFGHSVGRGLNGRARWDVVQEIKRKGNGFMCRLPVMGLLVTVFIAAGCGTDETPSDGGIPADNKAAGTVAIVPSDDLSLIHI